MFDTFLATSDLLPHLDDPHWVIFDCRFDLAEPSMGRLHYRQGHIPGAIYLHLDADLSNPPTTDHGRHPLPSADHLRERFGRWGIDATKQVIIYDTIGGAFAARLWWMLRYMGHENAAVLQGGWPAWQEAGLPTETGEVQPVPTTFVGQPNPAMFVTIDQVENLPLLIDSRDPQRYRGEVETIDARAGHIPSAINYFFGNNWDEKRLMRPKEHLRGQFKALFADFPADEATFYCGSGVTACFNLLAVAYAGLPLPKLYVGSWSEWSRDQNRPISTK